jgi:NADPH:quinone reductase-like Zn-dependent oxidoreductase
MPPHELFHLPTRLQFGYTKPKNNILGMDLAGEVQVIGTDVTRFKNGDQVYSLEKTAEAFRYVETGHKKGNVVITVTNSNK